MSTTIEDIHYEMYLEDLHNSYISALEKFASSNNLDELLQNLNKLELASKKFGLGLSPENKNLKKAMNEVKTLRKIYTAIEKSERRGNIRYVIGTILTIIGIALSIIGIIFTFK